MDGSKQLADLLRLEGIQDEAVLNAIATVPRHEFVPASVQDLAYVDKALPIGADQTISQPFVVARMTELIYRDEAADRVLEIGTGSGYQAAILAALYQDVCTIERIESLYEKSDALFARLEYDNIHTRFADGFLGWPEEAPFSAIIVTAAAAEVPPVLLEQLADNGRMVIPIGDQWGHQELHLIRRAGSGFEVDVLDPVMFVPMREGISNE